MKLWFLLFSLLLPTRIEAHRLDEYLQASLISIARDRVEIDLTLTPGVAVLPVVLAEIDTDSNGILSPAEQAAYARRVLRDLELQVDRETRPLRIVKSDFPRVAEMKEGLGEIRLKLTAVVSPARSPNHTLTFRNQHLARVSAWLVNCLVPPFGGANISFQDRDYLQAGILVRYSFPDEANTSGWPAPLAAVPLWLLGPGMLLLVRVGFLTYRRFGDAGRAVARK